MTTPLPHPYRFGDYGRITLSGLGADDTYDYGGEYGPDLSALPTFDTDTGGFDWAGLIGGMTKTAAETYLKTLQLQPGVYQVRTAQGSVSYVQPDPRSPLPGTGTAGFVLNKSGASGSIAGPGLDTNTMLILGIGLIVVMMMGKGGR